MGNIESKDEGQLWRELLEGVKNQLDINKRLEEVIEPILTSQDIGVLRPNEETVNTVKELFIEAESLQAGERAVFHQLFGLDADAV